jgi:hypothetical protein
MCINKFKYGASVLELNIPSCKHTNKYILFWLSNIRNDGKPKVTVILKEANSFVHTNKIGETHRVSALVALLIY